MHHRYFSMSKAKFLALLNNPRSPGVSSPIDLEAAAPATIDHQGATDRQNHSSGGNYSQG